MSDAGSRLRDEAAAWVARMDAAEWSEANEAELQDWLGLDPRHHGALLEMQATWMTLDCPSANSGRIGKEELIARADAEPERGLPRRAVLAGGGAAIAASIAGALAWQNWPTSFQTELGEIRRVPLADGSVATINTASKVEVKLADRRREVRLDQGEAWFQVAKDRARPFVVEAGRVRVQAVGTAFSVRRYADGAEVLVTEGVVEAWADGADGHRIRLGAGQRAFVADNAAIMSQPTAPSSVDRALAWRSGKIDLVGERLSSAIEEFNRYNVRKLVLADRALGNEQLDGVFRIDDPAGFAVAVRSALDASVDLSDPSAIRIGSAAPQR